MSNHNSTLFFFVTNIYFEINICYISFENSLNALLNKNADAE